jgi:hypothetical protein
MVDTIERPTIEPANDFRNAATSQAKVALEIDHDVAEYLKSQFSDWQGHANDLLRFFMETSLQKEREFENVFAQPEPGEDGPLPALT